jgi:hypothetical protein
MEFNSRTKYPKAKGGGAFFSGDSLHRTVIIGGGLSGRETAKAILKAKGETQIIFI